MLSGTLYQLTLNLGWVYHVCYPLLVELEGQKITWLTLHALQQVLIDDIDFSVMLMLLEFYEVLSYVSWMPFL